MSRSARAARRAVRPALAGWDPDVWDGDDDKVLDPVAGHGTFIAGIIANLAPGVRIRAERAISSYGDTDDATVAKVLLDCFELDNPAYDDDPKYDIVCMSFGGPTNHDDPPIALAEAIATIQARYARPVDGDDDLIQQRVVFVASAGNDASCHPVWPASFENVVGVGALGPDGPAPFTNYGPWVNACAPGVDIVSTFFDLGPRARFDDEHFDGWAKWSGTSFSAPIVTAQIAWEWMCRDNDERPGDSATWLIDRPGVSRYPGLGTVINFT